MKAFLLLSLFISLLANAGLLYRRTHKPITAPASTKARVVRKTSWGAELSFQWESKLRAGDPGLALKLQEGGFPPEVIRELLRSELRALSHTKAKELLRGIDPPPFWRENFDAGVHLTASEKLDMQREEEATLKKLLGDDFNLADVSKNPLYFFPPTIVERLDQIEEDYEALAATVRPEFSRVIMPAEREKLAFLESEKRAELAQLLTSEQLLEYDLRTSQTAVTLRDHLDAFQPTEEEFRDLFLIKREADLKAGLNSFSSTDPLVLIAQEKLQDDVEAKIEQRLGKQRFAEYYRAQDSDFQALHTVAARLNLPPEIVSQAYAFKTSLEERLEKAGAQQATPTSESTLPSIAALAAEAETRLREILGSEGFQAYKQNGVLFRTLSNYQKMTRLLGRSATEAVPPKS